MRVLMQSSVLDGRRPKPEFSMEDSSFDDVEIELLQTEPHITAGPTHTRVTPASGKELSTAGPN